MILNKNFRRVFLVVPLIFCVLTSLYARDGEPREHPDVVTSVDKSESVQFRMNYSDFKPLLMTKYEFLLYSYQLDNLDYQLNRDLHQVLNIKTSAVSLKNKKWNESELDKIIDECLRGDSK